MVAIFAFFAGLYYHLPIGYFLLGFILLLLDGDSATVEVTKNNDSNVDGSNNAD